MENNGLNCIYLGEPQRRRTYRCRLFGRCKLSGGGRRLPSCDTCRERLSISDEKFPFKWQDPLEVIDRNRRSTTALRGVLAGGAAFLLGGGPSAKSLPLEELNTRGHFSLAVNNMAGHQQVRPQAFVCADPPMKFSHSIWLDPAVMKFVPTPKLNHKRGRLRGKIDGVFYELSYQTPDCPNVWGFRRESWLEPNDRFFTTEGACWGNHNRGVRQTGQPKTVCTMLLALRLLYYLGARRIYLVGVDFHMSDLSGYSFPQGRTAGAAQSNNEQFRIVNNWLCQMMNNGTFQRFGLEVYNCYEQSGLRAFPYLPFDEAIADSRTIIEPQPDLIGWYEKDGCPRCSSWTIRCEDRQRQCLDCGLSWDQDDPPKFDKESKS